MFLCLPPVISTLGIPQGNAFFPGEMKVLTSPENHQFGSHPNPLELEPQLYSHSLTQATLNRYSRIYDAGGQQRRHGPEVQCLVLGATLEGTL